MRIAVTQFILASTLMATLAPMAIWAGPSVRVPAGRIRPFLDGQDAKELRIQAFTMDRYPVTNAEFAQFVLANPEWGPGRKPDLFADSNYLQHWFDEKERSNNRPVTNVSFFAAQEYCESKGMRLATTYEWEYAAAFPSAEAPRESSRDFAARILSWYARTGNELRPVGSGYKNVLNIYDLHGLIWEWTQDFNSATVGGDSRDAGESGLFCGAAATAASDPSQYANFMRYAFRSGLQARSTSKNLGFRCVRDI